MNRIVSSFRPRGVSTLRKFATAIKFSANGQASAVYKLEEVAPIGELSASQVALKFLAAPINPADINMAEGTYGIQPKLPAVGGNEGVAVVEKVGAGVKTLQVGDWVVPAIAPFGTWRQEAAAEESALVKVANDIPAPYAATLSVNPASAYRMLRDFVDLSPGDVIMQNGANSMVGLAVIQMAREMGIKTVNIVRSDRPDVPNTLRLLENLGGDINVPDEYVNTAEFNALMADLPGCKLALNCVGGDVATHMARALAPGGTLVTYGGMSKRPLTVPFELLAYKQLQMRGFWISQWYATHSAQEKGAMLDEIAQMVRDDELKFFFRLHDLDDFDHALARATEPFQKRKIVLALDYPDRMKEHDERDPVDYEIFEAPIV